MRCLGFEATKEEVRKIILEYDKDGNQAMDRDEFRTLMTEKLMNRDPKEEMMQAFGFFQDDNGKITFQSIKKVAQELGENMSDDEIMDLIHEADRDNDEKLNEEDFMRVMRKTGLFA